MVVGVAVGVGVATWVGVAVGVVLAVWVAVVTTEVAVGAML